MAGTRDGTVHGGRVTGAVRAGAAAAAVLVLGACAGGGSEGGTAGGAEMVLGQSGSMPPVAPSDMEVLVPTELSGIALGVPEEWEARQEGGALCVIPPGQPDCAYGSIRLVPHAAENHPQGWPGKDESFNDENGWAAAPDECRSLNTAASGSIGVREASLSHGFFDHADTLTSHHSVWTVTCANDDTFEVRMWFLPLSDVLLYVWSADAQYGAVYDRIAESMDTTNYQ
ncbi:hypothetical protein [Nocardiopsis sp. LOL_012]|uniref:hypothetical protein n=1 Tax=Nocardiopsis sp. LOL_012 TaxID=3345409 RepID=UPI003A89E2BF